MQLSLEEELEVRSCLAAIETEKRKKELKKKEKELTEGKRRKDWCNKPQKLEMPP